MEKKQTNKKTHLLLRILAVVVSRTCFRLGKTSSPFQNTDYQLHVLHKPKGENRAFISGTHTIILVQLWFLLLYFFSSEIAERSASRWRPNQQKFRFCQLPEPFRSEMKKVNKKSYQICGKNRLFQFHPSVTALTLTQWQHWHWHSDSIPIFIEAFRVRQIAINLIKTLLSLTVTDSVGLPGLDGSPPPPPSKSTYCWTNEIDFFF